ncbi:MAG: 23S rRNA (pseudouridine(1915)-N(3))-methyltransferase RlmH [Eggerthellaceae bacterium]|jgi:23S rRNA (pseudouridine1915-N3)-methyltransferase|nr:23S rRNA (pseudouridine(1915)-N(3))-methyltransferase RlmH [Eggerthellaceae bacterium]MCH4221272.1 23S rRNA (pseudouridine(1915)-N(3))-methyltransferase RlmH [Eggerthellaceae bacterium]
MLKVTVIAVGKLKERFWKEACAEYLKRLGGYVKIAVRELPDSSPENEEKEILRTLDTLKDTPCTILLDINGKERSSTQFAADITDLTVSGVSHIAFIIGGSDGVTEAVRQRATRRMSFGPITLPHNLARVVLLEQIYRACRIIRHEPYHK